jgi:thioredoxin reductase (NADPH)
MPDSLNKVTIIGSGPAGYTAAIYAARANLSPVVYAGGPAVSEPARVPGGQLMTTSDVENYPGFPESVTGPELMHRFQKQAERFGTRVILENVVKVDLLRQPFRIEGETESCLSQTVIIATGAAAMWLDIKGEHEFKNRGVSACATCDGAFFKNEDVLVVGGGDTAMEEATFLTRFGDTVTIVHRRGELRASKIMQERAMSNPKISFAWNSEVSGILGEDKVTGVKLRDTRTGEERELEADGLFIAIGHDPRSDLFKGQIELDDEGYVKVDAPTTRTNLEGVFACGDVVDHTYRQAITAAGTGCSAALDAERFLAALEHAESTLQS